MTYVKFYASISYMNTISAYSENKEVRSLHNSTLLSFMYIVKHILNKNRRKNSPCLHHALEHKISTISALIFCAGERSILHGYCDDVDVPVQKKKKKKKKKKN